MLIRILGGLAILAIIACTNRVTTTAGGETITIYRDKFGTPHVVARSNRGVYFGYGYAVATDRLFQMEMLRRTSQGRVAEVLGANYLELDTYLRTAYDQRAVKKQLAALPAPQREILQGYAAGFSQRVSEVLALQSTELPAEFSHYQFVPDTWSEYDVAMAFVGSIAHRYSDFNSERDNLSLLKHLEQKHDKDTAWRIFNASKWLLDNSSPTTVARTEKVDTSLSDRPGYLDALPNPHGSERLAFAEDGRFSGTTADPKLAGAQQQRIARDGFSYHPEFTGASNYWAVRNLQDAPAALLNGPQFGFATPSYVYGIGLHGGDFDVVGNTLLALPMLLFAHNNHIAWGSTAGISDQADEFMLALDRKNPERYRLNNNWQAFESWPEEIAVRDAVNVTVTARRSVHGMVMEHQPENGVAGCAPELGRGARWKH